MARIATQIMLGKKIADLKSKSVRKRMKEKAFAKNVRVGTCCSDEQESGLHSAMMALSEAACDRFAIDWLWTGDDVAGQQGLMMHPNLWRRAVKPHLQRVVDVGLAKGLPVAYHCCGALRPIIPDLIEMGIRILNPVQCNCPGMEPVDLKREFGRDLAFMGGVDTQFLLPHGTADDVRRATARLIESMTADGGGYILAASHTVPPETPDANIFAMYAEAGISAESIHDRAADIRRVSAPGV